MRRSLGILVAGTLLVSACQVQLNVPAPGKKGTATASKKEPRVTPSASPSASAAPVTTASAAAIAPTEPTALLKGLVKIDAAYVISTGGGNLIGQAGGNVISTGGGNVISTGGGNVIATGGGNVISVGGGNLIGQAGGNLIGQAGGNLIGQAGGNFRVQQATGIAPGTVLPVEKMVVVPVSLLDDRQVGPAVFTNEKGEFQVSIPEDLQGKVRLYAAVPGKDENDPNLKNSRYWYNLLASTGSANDLVIDEDTVRMSRLLRDTFKSKFIYYMTPSSYSEDEQAEWTSGEISIKFEEDVPQVQRALITTTITQLRSMVQKHAIPQARTPDLARRMADAMLARIDLQSIVINTQAAPTWTGPPTPAIPFMVELMRELRLRTQEKMDAKAITLDYPAGLKAKIDAINAEITLKNEQDKAWNAANPDNLKSFTPLRPYLNDPTYQIERASDLTEFLVAEFFTGSTEAFKNGRIVLADLQRAGEGPEVTEAYMAKFDVGGKSVGMAFALEFIKFQHETYADTDPEVKRRPELKGRNKLDALFEDFSRSSGS